MADPRDSETLVHVEVPLRLRPQLRLYRRLYLARIDLDEAKATVAELLARRLPLPRSKPPSALLMSLTTALVVAYARPFANSRGVSDVADKSVPGALLRVLSSGERHLHDALLDIRNKEMAHSDADILEISIKLIDGDDVGIFRDPRRPFQRRTLQVISRMLEKLNRALDQRCEELRTELPLDVWL
jgi:hypothetical protein